MYDFILLKVQVILEVNQLIQVTNQRTPVLHTFWNLVLNTNPVAMHNLLEKDGNQDKLH